MVEIKIEPCNKDNVECISDILENLNALSITLTDLQDDPILEPLPGSVPLWPNVVVQALFATDLEADNACNQITQQYPNLNCSMQQIAENDWERVCIADLKPQIFGKNLCVCPSWLTPPDATATIITLDPGLAFGTGTHPTTSLCLNWLDANDVCNKDVIDYGCGSGILGIAALKLGAKHVYAIDLDPQALTATQQNADLNQIASSQLTITLPEIPPPPADWLIANILLNPLINLKNAFRSYLKDDGVLVVSGILCEQVEELIEAYRGEFKHHETMLDGDWGLVVLSR